METLSQNPTAGRLVITGTGDLHGEDTPANRELARRVRACINACDGISTEELERGLIQDLCRVVSMVAPLLQQPPRPADRAA